MRIGPHVNNPSTNTIHASGVLNSRGEEGEGWNKGIAGVGWKTGSVRARLGLIFKRHFLIVLLHVPYSAETWKSIFKLGKKNDARRRDGRQSGGEGEAAESSGRRERCCVCHHCHSAAARFRSRRACRREESGKNGGEEDGREGEKGSAWAALQQQQLQQPVRKKEDERKRQRKGREACSSDLKEAFFCMISYKENGLSEKGCCLSPDAF